MNDPTAKTTTALAIVEKRPHRPVGGCVGIFFKLFDWNSRFAKKKLFSKKLLPSVRAKQALKKFGGDEKLPKHRLIADENSGGFPNVKKNGSRDVVSEDKHEMQAPGLIARLMGLETMPAAQKDKSRNASLSGTGSNRGEKLVMDHTGFDRQDLNLEKGGLKQEQRPQKLQKTGPLEKRPVTKCGAEPLHFKNVLSRARKHNPKFPSPVKSPRTLSGRKASKLIGTATKILEPGLQASSRAKCALTYTNTLRHAPKDEVTFEWTPTLSMDPLQNSSYVSPSKSLSGQSSCKNCGSFVDSVDFRLNVEEQPSAVASSISNDINLTLRGLARSKQKGPTSSLKQGSQTNFQESKEHSATVSDQAINNIQPCSECISDKKPLYECRIQWNLKSEQCKPKRKVPSSTSFKQKTLGKNQVSLSGNGVPPQSKLSNLQRSGISVAANAISEPTKFASLNQCLSRYTLPRIPAKVDSCKLKEENEFSNRRANSLPPARKRRSMNDSRQGKGSDSVSSTGNEPRNINSNATTGKGVGCNVALSMNQTYIRTRLSRLRDNKQFRVTGNDKNDVISFTFSSPMKQKTKMPAQVDNRIGQNDCGWTSTPQKSLELDENEKTECLQKPLPLRGDVLGALLEEKLKELTCQEDESAIRGALPKKTTAMILQELISALTAETSFREENVALRCKQKNCSYYDGHISNTMSPIAFQAQTSTRASVNVSHEGDHLSPGSVLDASFSNESCFSGSLDDSLVPEHKPHDDFMDCSCHEAQPVEPDADLVDSGTSLKKRSIRELNTLVSHISGVLCNLNLADAGLKESKLAYAAEGILAAELVLGGAVPHFSDGDKDFSISCFLRDELEALARVIWENFGSLGAEDAREGYQLKGFAFDCVIEYLDSRYGPYSKTGLGAWSRLSFCKNAEMLIHEVINEVRRWRNLAGLIIDELIDKEMSYALGKWTNFEIEAFETGAQIDGYILQNLIDEIVDELSF